MRTHFQLNADADADPDSKRSIQHKQTAIRDDFAADSRVRLEMVSCVQALYVYGQWKSSVSKQKRNRGR